MLPGELPEQFVTSHMYLNYFQSFSGWLSLILSSSAGGTIEISCIWQMLRCM